MDLLIHSIIVKLYFKEVKKTIYLKLNYFLYDLMSFYKIKL
jgi:hypothetical protein